jgi:DNA polymerase III alpha subunit
MRQAVAYIRDSRPTEVRSLLLVTLKEKRTVRKGTSFLSLRLADSTGEIRGVIWHNIEAANAALEIGNVVEICGSADEYRGEAQIIIDRIRRRKRSSLQLAEYPNLDLDMLRIEPDADRDGPWVSTNSATAVMLATQNKVNQIVSRISNPEEAHRVQKPASVALVDKDRIARIVDKYKKD